MFNKPGLGRQIAQKTTLMCLLGITCWVALLLRTSSIVKEAALSTVHDISIGPLVLGSITKQVSEGSYSAIITFKAGLIWYIVGWLGLGVLAGWIAARRRQRLNTT